MKKALLLLGVALVLGACGGNEDLFVLPRATPASEVAVRVQSIEVRDVVVPAYVADANILVQDADGALRPLGGALWADDPRTGITQALATRLDLGTSATAAAEPWPLFDGPDLRVQVIVERMIARADGLFEFSGQFAVVSPSGAQRDFLRRFDITTPHEGANPQSVADALGRALALLSDQITASIAR